MLGRLDLGTRCLVVEDLRTREVAGERAIELLSRAGFRPKPSLFESRESVRPDESAIGKVMLDMDADTDFLVVVGSGCLTDVTRFISGRTGVPFVSVPTAPSMDGYASTGSPMSQSGHKRTIIATNALDIVADTEILARAPHEMIASGYSDTIGKLTSRLDWELSNIVTDEYCCPFFVERIADAVENCAAVADRIRAGDPAAVGTLAEALMLSGIAMSVVGNSRPASGSEHSLSHYWEMKAHIDGRPEFFHGTKVGVGTGIVARFYEAFFSRDPASVDLESIRRRKQSLEEIESDLVGRLGSVAAGIIAEVAAPQYLSWPEQEGQIRRIQDSWTRIEQLRKIAPSFDEVSAIQRGVDAPVDPAAIAVDTGYLRESILTAKEVRGRYTVFRAAETLGWLEEIAEEVSAAYAVS